MAETPTASTRPTRTRASRAAKATPAKAAPAAAPASTEAPKDRFTVDFVAAGETKRYAKFTFPAETDGVVVGSIYAPPGTTAVKVLIIGATPPAAE